MSVGYVWIENDVRVRTGKWNPRLNFRLTVEKANEWRMRAEENKRKKGALISWSSEQNFRCFSVAVLLLFQENERNEGESGAEAVERMFYQTLNIIILEIIDFLLFMALSLLHVVLSSRTSLILLSTIKNEFQLRFFCFAGFFVTD